MKKTLYLLIALCCCCAAQAQIITTVAGTDSTTYNGDNIPATTGDLNQPINVIADNAGNFYIAAFQGNRIRKVDASGNITTIAGTGVSGYSGDGGPATAATISIPTGMALDAAGNFYFCDANNNRVRKINTSGIITTIAGTGGLGYDGDGIPATDATIWIPNGLTFDAAGNLYIGDGHNSRIRKIDVAGIITTFAGNGLSGYLGDGGAATNALLSTSNGMAIDASGNLYFSDIYAHVVRKIDTSGIITTIAGTGVGGYNGDDIPATTARLNYPSGIAVDQSGNLFIADAQNNRIRKIDSAGMITTVCGDGTAAFTGDGGPATGARLNAVSEVFIDHSGGMYVADLFNNRIRYITHVAEGVNDINDNTQSLTIYPNPAQSEVTITGVLHTANYSLLNIVGKCTMSGTLQPGSNTLSLVQMPAGIYLVKIYNHNGELLQVNKVYKR